MIKVEGVTKRYGTTTAVKNISFEVEQGEIVGFLGPNGAGKTTTMRILTGFLPPTDGKASVAGFDVLEEPLELKKRIGYLPQDPPVYTEMEVDEYLDFVARIKGIEGAQVASSVNSAIERTSIEEVRSKVIGKLSKGYKQRVGLAQALIHNPDVLILDEPTAGLDPAQIREVRDLIRNLAGDHTILLSTHILSEVADTCTRVIIISEGEIEASDTPENLRARLQGGASTRLEIDGPAEEIEPRLSSIEGVERVTPAGEANGHSVWTIETAKDAEVSGQLAKAVVESGWGLHELHSVGLSLEDVFLKLTTADEAAVDAVPEPHAAEEPPPPEAETTAETPTEAPAQEAKSEEETQQ